MKEIEKQKYKVYRRLKKRELKEYPELQENNAWVVIVGREQESVPIVAVTPVLVFAENLEEAKKYVEDARKSILSEILKDKSIKIGATEEDQEEMLSELKFTTKTPYGEETGTIYIDLLPLDPAIITPGELITLIENGDFLGFPKKPFSVGVVFYPEQDPTTNYQRIRGTLGFTVDSIKNIYFDRTDTF